MEALLLALKGIFVCFEIGSICEQRERDSFERRFPPISDEEFVACCPPGTDASIALRVRGIVARQLQVEYDRVHPSMHFVHDLGC